MKKLDLHIHTNKSDGILNPMQVIDESIKNSVDVISITDHDTLDAYTDDLKDCDILEIINDMQADGIEANYIYIDHNNNIKNDIQFWNNFARKHKLITTIGSDFHNKDGLRPEIGLTNYKCDNDLINIEKLIKGNE